MKLRFDLEWRTLVFVIVMVPLLIALGFWQLSRAEEKRALAAAFEEQQALPPVRLVSLLGEEPESLVHRRVLIKGRFVPGARIFLDNRLHEGRFGYEVVDLLRLDAPDSGRLVLVNRGWVAGDASRQSLPELAWADGEQVLQGRIYRALGAPFLLAPQNFSGDFPLVLQALEMDTLAPALSERLHGTVLPYSVRLDGREAAALVADWPVVNVSPAKHVGYAVQWFCMALVLALIFLIRSSNLLQVLRGKPREAS